MTAILPNMELKHREPLSQQIAGHLRRSILSGETPGGTKLPAAQDIAQRYGTSVFTVHTSLATLAREGLITRKQRSGSFVCHRQPAQATVGIYFGTNFWQGNEMAFYQALCMNLRDCLKHKQMRHQLWTDSRSEEQQNRPLPELIQAVGSRQLQGLIVASTNPREMQWLEKLGIPFALLGSAPVPSRVLLDSTQMLGCAMREFKRQGCRSVGCIVPFPVWGTEEADHAEDITQFSQDFQNIAMDVGLKTRSSWIRTPPTCISAGTHEQFGYSQFQQVWNQPERPDGLFIFPDTIVRGSLTAILEAGVRVPGELKLALHRTTDIPLICPLPASWAVTDVKLIATELVSQLEQALSGQEVLPRKLPIIFEPAKPIPSHHSSKTTTNPQ